MERTSVADHRGRDRRKRCRTKTDMNPARSRAPLLETISTLSSLVYSDRSSSSSSSSNGSESETESPPGGPSTAESAASAEADDDGEIQEIKTPSDAEDLLQVAKSSRVRFQIGIGGGGGGGDVVANSNSSTSTLNSVPETNNGNQQQLPHVRSSQPPPKIGGDRNCATKSILKDPLCAKLRSCWVGTKPTALQPSEASGKPLKPSTVIVDAQQLESEIDQLLYGPCLVAADHETTQDEDDDDVDAILTNLPSSAIDLMATTGRNRPPPSSASRNQTSKLPFQTYIQMIEEKYRMQQQQQSQDPALKPKTSGVRCNNKAAAPNPNKPARLMKKSVPGSSKSNILSMVTSSHQSYRMHHQPPPPVVVNPPRAQHSSLDQWLATLAQETTKPKSTTTATTEPNSKPTHAPETGEKDDDNRQEELYSLLSDPVNGPPINTLMDQLSKSFGVSIGTRQPDGTLSPAPSFSSSRSSCSTGKSRSLVENHIYEEILYECLQQQQRS